MEMLNKLNDKQLEAVLDDSKQLLILAGAGTGKTSTLTSKIAYKIQHQGVNPYNILAITFTNKAANEMRERIKKEVGEIANDMWILTFHAACLRILRRHITKLGYSKSFVIYDTEDKSLIIKKIMKELNMGDSIKPKLIEREISNAKLLGLSPKEYYELSAGAFDFTKKFIAQVYTMYQQNLKESNAIDFDDLIMMTVELFDKDEEIRNYYSDRFEYIFVDEYQDTNNQQFKLIEQLARNHKNLCVVGDDDQSIYKFRGADIQNILGFEKLYKKAKIIKLEQNYRSTKNILNVANLVIENNKKRKTKKLWTENDIGDKVEAIECSDPSAEAQMVVEKMIEFKKSRKFDYKDMIILYRSNAQSRAFEEYLLRNGILYEIYSGINFYARKEIKDIIAYLKVLVNSSDIASIRRIINVPKRGIGDATVGKIENFANENGISVFEAMLRVDEIDELSKSTKTKIANFIGLINDFKEQSNMYTVDALISNIINDISYIRSIEDKEERNSRADNLNELISKAKQYEESDAEDKSLLGFLQDIALFINADADTDKETDKVLLMTIHASKGLEFPCVFLVGVEEGIFPSKYSIDDFGDDGIEEERRLCYVALTRAKKFLQVSGCRSRYFGFTTMSRFVKEMLILEENNYESKKPINEFSYIDKTSKDYNKKVKLNRENFRVAEIDTLDFGLGDRVKHRKFGEGTVLDIYKNSEGMKAVKVDFDNSGEKEMVAAYAKLSRI